MSRFNLEANRHIRGMSMLIGGVVGIREYSDTAVTLATHGGRVGISGRRLALTVYENNSVEIVGRIEEVTFGYGKNK
jgi:hypothetical protein